MLTITIQAESVAELRALIGDFLDSTGAGAEMLDGAKLEVQQDKKTRKAKTTPAPEVEKEPEPKALTLEDVQTILIKRAEGITDPEGKKKNRNTITSILSEYGVGTVTDLAESDYEEFVDRIKSLK